MGTKTQNSTANKKSKKKTAMKKQQTPPPPPAPPPPTSTISEKEPTTMPPQESTNSNTKLTIGKMTLEEWEKFQETLKAYQTSPTPGNWGGLVHLKLDTEWNKESFRLLKEWAYSQIESYVELHQEEGVSLGENVTADDKIIKIIPHFSLDDDDDDDDDSSASDESANETKTDNADNPPKQKIGLIGMHISLSKPFFLQHQNIESFISNLTKRFEKCFDPFHVMFEPNAVNDPDDSNTASSPSCQIQVLVNPRGTRSFLTLPMNPNSTEKIIDLIHATDDVMKEYNMPTFYPQPKIHVSVASAVGNLNELYGENSDSTAAADANVEMKEEDTTTKPSAPPISTPKPPPIMFHVKSIQCDFGQSEKKFTIPFRGVGGTV